MPYIPVRSYQSGIRDYTLKEFRTDAHNSNEAPGIEVEADLIGYRPTPHDELQVLKAAFDEASNSSAQMFGLVARLQKRLGAENGDDPTLTDLFKEARKLKRNMTKLGGRMAECFVDLETSLVEQQTKMTELEITASTDSLTGLRNRLYFNVAMSEMVPVAHEENQDLCVLAFDIDHFKKVNDTYGHAMGDAVLQAFAVALRSELRGKDLVARMGGEEFVAVLPETEIEAALLVAENVRRRVEHMHAKPFVFKGAGIDRSVELPPVTVSIGVSEIMPQENYHTLVDRADNALYFAKNSGRNRVEEAASHFSVKGGPKKRRAAPGPANAR